MPTDWVDLIGTAWSLGPHPVAVKNQARAALEQIKALRSSGAKVPGLDRLEGDAYFDLNQLKEADAAFARALQADAKDAAADQVCASIAGVRCGCGVEGLRGEARLALA